MNISQAEILSRKKEISQMSYEREKSVWSIKMSAKGVRCYSSPSNAFCIGYSLRHLVIFGIILQQ